MSDPARAEAEAGAVFEALGDPTRRSVLRAVAEHGPITATELSQRLPVTRQAIAKHLGVLLHAELVSEERAGRERRFRARTAPLTDASRWLATTGTAWDERLGRLAERIQERARDRGAAPGRQ